MAVLVHSQDVQIVKIEENAVNVEQDMETGLTHVKKAVVHARNARKWRWVCCVIFTIILVRFFPLFLLFSTEADSFAPPW
jgi:syntaxin 1B/2/3